MSGRLAYWMCLGCVLVACNGVGRSVVGELGPPIAFEVCEKPLPCEPIEVDEPQAVPEQALPVDIRQCRHAGATLCPASATTPAGQCPVASAGLERSFQGSSDLEELGCVAVHIVRSAADPAQARIELKAWNQVHVDIESVEPATLELVGGQSEQVSLALHGPITLRILDSDRVRELRILAGDSAAQIELVRTSVGSLSIDAPQGQVLLRRSMLGHVNISAKGIALESSSIADATWRAATLNAVDATLRRIRSDVERSVLSACDVSMTSFMSCQSLTAVQGSLTDVRMFACAEEAGIYGGTVVHSQLEGDLILDATTLVSNVLGLGEVGSIAAWDAHLMEISFCADQQPLTLGGTSAARCVHCNLTPVLTQPDTCELEHLVSLDPTASRVEDSFSCPALLKIPLCREPRPERMRPPLR